MSQNMDSKDPTSNSASGPTHDSAGPSYGQFDYRPMPVVAPVALVLGVCSLLAYLGLFGIGIAMLGSLIGLMAVWTIGRSQGALSGMWVGLLGMLLCMTNMGAGIGLQVYHYNHEVPDGYSRVNFTEQISKQGFNTEHGKQVVTPQVKAFVDQPIFLKGFMYPTGQTEGLRTFLLLKDSGQCCFGGKPALTDMIGIRSEEGEEVDYYSGRVAVAGTFIINEHYEGGDLDPVYLLDAQHFSPARTAF